MVGTPTGRRLPRLRQIPARTMTISRLVASEGGLHPSEVQLIGVSGQVCAVRFEINRPELSVYATWKEDMAAFSRLSGTVSAGA